MKTYYNDNKRIYTAQNNKRNIVCSVHKFPCKTIKPIAEFKSNEIQ